MRSQSRVERALGVGIRVVGVGGGGGNAVRRMVSGNLAGVRYLVLNTDIQALRGLQERSDVRHRAEHDGRFGFGRSADSRAQGDARESEGCVEAAGRRGYGVRGGGHGRRHRNGRGIPGRRPSSEGGRAHGGCCNSAVRIRRDREDGRTPKRV